MTFSNRWIFLVRLLHHLSYISVLSGSFVTKTPQKESIALCAGSANNNSMSMRQNLAGFFLWGVVKIREESLCAASIVRLVLSPNWSKSALEGLDFVESICVLQAITIRNEGLTGQTITSRLAGVGIDWGQHFLQGRMKKNVQKRLPCTNA